MVLRLLRGAMRLHPLRLALVVLSTAMGSGIAAALGTVSLEVGDRLAAELRSFGANVVVEPAVAAAPGGVRPPQSFLEEAHLQRILTIFWRHNVVGLAPSLTAPVALSARGRSERALLAGVWFDRRVPRPGQTDDLRAGVAPLFPHWGLEGRWPTGGATDEAVLGRALAARLGARPGDSVTAAAGDRSRALRVVGIVSSGGFEEDQAMVELEAAQQLLGRPGQISRALVSALTVPLDAFGRRDPGGMTQRELEKWFCTPYVTSVARQVEEAIPGSRARPVWSLAEAEARVLSRLGILMAILAGLSLAAAALAVASTFAARVLGRRTEIALLRATGASAWQVSLLLGSELLALGAVGGVLAAGLALVLVRVLGEAVFGTPIEAGAAVAPLAIGGALLVAAAGSVWPIRRALALDPAPELKEAA